MTGLHRDTLFVALTRPQMFGGVTYGYFVFLAIALTEAFLVLRSIWVIPVAIALYAFGAVACAREPRIFALWRTQYVLCPRVRAYRRWRCNSYRP